ncbi:hypothetical protein OF897_20660 [Chryseobacterium formosus]|uniref:Ig-like domain-containing protein n=1 Tax=Chryseobacterium formosus TaxID=1537363 RepID=A0ABT3XXG6_9FLAO|nr:hypothetical protein [Chryseobacterium formosus]MCX8526332.1 hypothetical protein [Chryseobacterium formosus]
MQDSNTYKCFGNGINCKNRFTWTNIPSSNANTITTFVSLPSPSSIFPNYNTRLYKVAVTGPLGTATVTRTAVYNCYEKAVSNQPRTTQEMKPEIKAIESVSPIPATNVFTVNLNLPDEDYVEI